MSYTTEHTIWCDEPDCGAWAQEAGMTVTELRRWLAPQGWVRLGKRDLCPRHRPAGHPMPHAKAQPDGARYVDTAVIRDAMRDGTISQFGDYHRPSKEGMKLK